MDKTRIMPIAELKAEGGEDRLRYFSLPSSRIIGKSMRCPLDKGAPNQIPAFWDSCISEGLFDKIKTPDRLLPAMLGFTDDFDAKTNTFLYIIGALFSESTPVPEGCVFRDIPATIVSVGVYGKWLEDCCRVWKADGFEWNSDKGQCWNSELYIDGEDNNGFRLLCAVKSK